MTRWYHWCLFTLLLVVLSVGSLLSDEEASYAATSKPSGEKARIQMLLKALRSKTMEIAKLKQEVARLRALCLKHGINPDKPGRERPGYPGLVKVLERIPEEYLPPVPLLKRRQIRALINVAKKRVIHQPVTLHLKVTNVYKRYRGHLDADRAPDDIAVTFAGYQGKFLRVWRRQDRNLIYVHFSEREKKSISGVTRNSLVEVTGKLTHVEYHNSGGWLLEVDGETIKREK